MPPSAETRRREKKTHRGKQRELKQDEAVLSEEESEDEGSQHGEELDTLYEHEEDEEVVVKNKGVSHMLADLVL